MLHDEGWESDTLLALLCMILFQFPEPRGWCGGIAARCSVPKGRIGGWRRFGRSGRDNLSISPPQSVVFNGNMQSLLTLNCSTPTQKGGYMCEGRVLSTRSLHRRHMTIR